MSARAVVAAGSNLGDRVATLTRGLALLAVHPQVSVAAVSPLYETGPVGGPVQGDFLNLVALLDTELPPRTLLGLLHVVEAAAGRERAEHWGPRTLDLDLIVYDDFVSEAPYLAVPHPRAHERAFVLRPWLDIDPEASLPGRGRVDDLLRQVEAAVGSAAGVRRFPVHEVTP